MQRAEPNSPQDFNPPTVSITISHGYSLTNMMTWASEKLADYCYAAHDTYRLINEFDGASNRDALHQLIQHTYDNFPADDVKVFVIRMLEPGYHQIVQRIVVIADPLISKRLRQYPHSETFYPSYYNEHPDIPKINGGNASVVLNAIGMGMHSNYSKYHSFYQIIMSNILNIQRIKPEKYKYDAFKLHFVKITALKTKKLIHEINFNMSNVINFRMFSLSLFITAFFPDMTFDSDWLKELSDTIEDISNLAFTHLINSYANKDELKKFSDMRLYPFLDKMMRENQSIYLGKDYFDFSKEIQREIIIALLFLCNDIEKYLNHIFVEFGSRCANENYLNKPLNENNILDMMKVDNI